SGDPGYYARANAAVERALALDPNDYGALRTAPWVLLGLHDFRGALAAAERARAVEPEDWWNYGTLADACGELGDYARALQAAQRMVDLRPGTRSSSTWVRSPRPPGRPTGASSRSSTPITTAVPRRRSAWRGSRPPAGATSTPTTRSPGRATGTAASPRPRAPRTGRSGSAPR